MKNNLLFSYSENINQSWIRQPLLFSLILMFPLLHAQHAIGFTGGTILFQFPPKVSTATISAWGAGGAGGGVDNSNGAKVGAGGGGGAFAQLSTFSVIGSTIYSGYAGVGGTGVNAGNGGPGTDSWFVNNTTLLAKAGMGGNLGTTTSYGTAGMGGLALSSIGDIKYNGGNGTVGLRSNYSGAGGGSAGSGGNGGNATIGTGGTAGAGLLTGAVGANGIVGNGNGAVGNIPGSGGSGGSRLTATTTRKGGDGGDGEVLISYNGYCRPLASSTATYVNAFSTTGGVSNISNSATGIGAYGYQNFYDTHSMSIATGSSFTASFTLTGGTAGLAIWVDWNNNNVFEPSESIYNSAAYISSGTTGSIAIPAVLPGDYVMRVVADYWDSSPDPCDLNSIGLRGEGEDYKITILCPTITAITITETPAFSGGATACDLDYVKLDGAGGNIANSIAYVEDFSAGVGINWAYGGTNGNVVGVVYASNNAGGTSFEAGLQDVGSSSSGSWNIRPYDFSTNTDIPISIKDYSTLNLSFKYMFDAYLFGFYTRGIYLDVSTDDVNWSTAWSNTGITTSIAANTVNVNLNPYTGNDQLFIRFRYTGDNYGLNNWYLDDITISGNKNLNVWSPPTGLYIDAALTIPYTGQIINTVYAAPDTSTAYTSTATLATCSKTATTASIIRTKKVFTGLDVANPTLWNVANNWATKSIPTADKCVNIPSGKSVTVDIPSAVAKTVTVASGGKLSITANNALSVTDQFTNSNPSNLVPLTSPQQYYVMIESDGNLLQTNNVANVGDIAARRVVNIQNNQQYNYLISPLINTDLKNNIYEDQTTHVLSNTPFTLYHNEATNKFYNSSGAYIAGRGLALKEPASGTGQINVLYKGVPMNGPLSYTIVNSTPGDSVHGYNLIGNPYPSNLDLISFFNDNNSGSNLDPTFYFWDSQANTRTAQEGDSYGGQAYATFNAVTPPIGGTGTKATGDTGTTVTKVPNQYVKVGQAFMARPLSSSLTVDFKNTQRVSNAATGFFGKQSNATTPFDRYWLNLISPTNIVSNIAVVYFQGGDDAYTKADSRSLVGSDAIYSLVDNEKISINGKNTFANTDVVALGSQHFENGNYTISLSAEKDGVFENGQNIYLKDKQTGIITNLSEGNYTFTATEGESTGRFEIVYKPEIVLATDGTVKENLQVYKDHQDFVVKAKSKKITDVELYDATGRLILKSKQNSTEVRLNAETLSNGVYVLKIMQDNLQTVKKIIK